MLDGTGTGVPATLRSIWRHCCVTLDTESVGGVHTCELTNGCGDEIELTSLLQQRQQWNIDGRREQLSLRKRKKGLVQLENPYFRSVVTQVSRRAIRRSTTVSLCVGRREVRARTYAESGARPSIRALRKLRAAEQTFEAIDDLHVPVRLGLKRESRNSIPSERIGVQGFEGWISSRSRESSRKPTAPAGIDISRPIVAGHAKRKAEDG